MKKQKTAEISALVEAFGEKYFNQELASRALRLCEDLSNFAKPDISKGKKEIWAAAIVYVIARVNFLFDKESSSHLSADCICEFFGTKKSTTGNKATVIERTVDIFIGDERYCMSEIQNAFSCVELSNGLIIPESMLIDLNMNAAEEKERELVVSLANEEESREIEMYLAQKKIEQEKAALAQKARLEEKKKKKAEELKAKIDKRQLKLWSICYHRPAANQNAYAAQFHQKDVKYHLLSVLRAPGSNMLPIL